MTWASICPYDDLPPDRGVTALVDGEQVAVFRLSSGELFALGNQDPYSGAYVLARGLVGSRGEEPVVASPMFKQTFSLRTGVALDEPTVSVATYPVRVRDGQVEVAVTAAAA